MKQFIVKANGVKTIVLFNEPVLIPGEKARYKIGTLSILILRNGLLFLYVDFIPTATVNAATTTEKSVGMQKTGLPIAGLILAMLAVCGGFLVPKRK